MNGGDTTANYQGGGGGAGGAIRLVGGSIENNGELQARGGGIAPGGIADMDGTGGRIAFDSNGTIKIGTYDLSGHYMGRNDRTFLRYPTLDGSLAIRGDSGVNNLSFASGTLTIDTSAAYWYHSGGDHGSGVIQSHDDGGITYKTCTFTFNSISLTGSLNVVLQGDNSLILKTQSNGNINVGVDLSADAIDQTYDNSRSPSNTHHWRSVAKLGGRNGRLNNEGDGYGPGKGQTRVSGTLESDGLRHKGGGGGYGSAGEFSSGGFGESYGSASLAHLHGGSSGGSGHHMGSGAGGGAISLEAHGDGNVTIQSGVTVSANGSGTNQRDTNDRNGGGGSGGSLRFAGNYIVNNGTISAKGGSGVKLPSGGGGRVAFNFRSGLTKGTVDVGLAPYNGTVAENSTPVIINPGVINLTYDNLNYQAPATRANDLVLWYKFDETSGTTVKDSSGNGRNGTAMNAGTSSWVPGVLGNALKMDSGTMTSENSGGQYVDMGSNWTIGGSVSFSMWLYLDIFANWARVMDIGNGAGVDNILIAGEGTQDRFQFGFYNTGGGQESHTQNGSALLQEWFHVAFTIDNGGINASRYRVYMNGAFLGMSNNDKSPPISKVRTNSYLGRSNWGNDSYFKGKMDDFRIYVGELNANDVALIYGETAPPTAGSVNALYGPTAFTATGLPSGLTIDSTGNIIGRTTAVGDHSVTVGASNLSGTANTETITIRVQANKPVFASTENTFSPLDLTPALWVDAADTTTVTIASNAVSEWKDKSGNNRHLTQTTAGSRPSYVSGEQNGLSVVRFDGTDDYLNGSGITNIGSFAIFAVTNRHTADSVDEALLASDGSWSSNMMLIRNRGTTNLTNKLDIHSGGMITGSNPAVLNSWAIDSFTRGDVASTWGSTGTLFHNGSTDGSGALGGSASVSLANFNVGSWNTGAYMDGDIAELIIYTAKLSDHERQTVEVYLARKWGLLSSMPSTIPSPSDASKNPYVSSIGGNSVTTSVPLVDNGGEDANVTIYYGTVDRGPTTGSSWNPLALNVALWYDANDDSSITHNSNSVSEWRDKSGSNRHLTQGTSSSQPTTGGVLNGKNALNWTDAKKMSRSGPTGANWQDAYIVAKWTGGSAFNYHGLITGTNSAGTSNIGLIGDNSTGLYTGNWWNNFYLNGTSNAGTSVLTTMSSPFMASISANSSISINGFAVGSDRLIGSRGWIGQIAEVVVFNSKLSDDDRYKVEGYLAEKWGLRASLPSGHTYKSSLPAAVTWDGSVNVGTLQPTGSISSGLTGLTTNTSYFFRMKATNAGGTTWSDAYAFRTGTVALPPAIITAPVSNVATTSVTTAGNLLSYDGNDQPTVTLYYDADENVSTDIPKAFGNLKVWLDANDTANMDTGYTAGSSQPANNGLVGFWKDKSGNNNHAVAVSNSAGNRPTYLANGFTGTRPTLHFNGKYMSVTNSASGFDAWDKMTVYVVIDEQANQTWRYWFGKVNAFNTDTGNAWSFRARRGDTNPPAYGFRIHGTSASDNIESASMSIHDPAIMVFTFGQGKRTMHLNNAILIDSPDSGTLSSNNSVPLTIGGLASAGSGANLHISEFIVYNEVVAGLDREIMEGYLAHKWGIASSLPTGHLYKSSAPSGIKTPQTAVSLGQKQTGSFTHNLTGLASGKLYHYRYKAANNGGSGYSDTNSFVTVGTPSINVTGATDVTPTAVTLNTKIESSGGVSFQVGGAFLTQHRNRHDDVDGWK